MNEALLGLVMKHFGSEKSTAEVRRMLRFPQRLKIASEYNGDSITHECAIVTSLCSPTPSCSSRSQYTDTVLRMEEDEYLERVGLGAIAAYGRFSPSPFYECGSLVPRVLGKVKQGFIWDSAWSQWWSVVHCAVAVNFIGLAVSCWQLSLTAVMAGQGRVLVVGRLDTEAFDAWRDRP